MLLLIASIIVQVIAVSVALYYVAPLGWIVALLRLRQSYYPYIPGASVKSENIRGIKICYVIRKPRLSSTDGPTAVFIHGITSDKNCFYSLFKYLPKSWTLIALDFPGHGGSTFRDDVNYTHVEMEAFFHEFFQRLGLRSFHLIGQSMGSAYCSQYTAKHPDIVQSLTMICPPGLHRIGGQRTECITTIDDRRKLQDESLRNPFLPKSRSELQRSMKLGFFKPPCYPHRVLDAMVKMGMENYPYYRKVMLDVHSLASVESVTEMVNGVRVPLHIIWGREDKVFHVSGTDVIKRMKEEAKISIIDNCGHVVSLERPAVCSMHIAEFVQLVTSGRSPN